MPMWNDVDGCPPGDGGPEAVRERTRVLLAELDLLARHEARRLNPPPPYLSTHGPWDPMRCVCLTCRQDLVSIHYAKLRCCE
jgi:hypothetical protein